MFAARRASMYFRKHEQLRALGLLLNARRADPFFLDTAVIESTSATGLNLYLNANDREKVREVPGITAAGVGHPPAVQPGAGRRPLSPRSGRPCRPRVAPDTRGP